MSRHALPKLVALQVLRGCAALAIALVHLETEWRALGAVPQGWTRPFPWEAGVDVFFVISGFVMVYASAGLFGREGGARLFLARRTARIVPLYWLTTTLVLALVALKPDLMRSAVATPEMIAASFLFIPWTRPDGLVQPVYTLGWTLNYEMFFYVVFAAVLALRMGRRTSVATVGAILLLLIGFGLLVRPASQPLAFWTSSMLIAFVLGMALGLARVEGVTLPLPARIGLLAIGISLFWFVGGDLAMRTGRDTAFVFALPSACLVAACGLGPGRPEGRQRDGSPSHWLARAGESLGDASYAIYLLHPFAIRGTLKAIDISGLGPRLGVVGLTIAALAATIALALVSYRFVERPLTRLARRMLEPR